MANLISAERIEWKTFVPESFPCSINGCPREATLFVVVEDGAVRLRVAVCGTCMHVLGAAGIAAAMMVRDGGGGESDDDRPSEL